MNYILFANVYGKLKAAKMHTIRISNIIYKIHKAQRYF